MSQNPCYLCGGKPVPAVPVENQKHKQNQQMPALLLPAKVRLRTVVDQMVTLG